MRLCATIDCALHRTTVVRRYYIINEAKPHFHSIQFTFLTASWAPEILCHTNVFGILETVKALLSPTDLKTSVVVCTAL